MVRPGRDRLSGLVEVDETFWGSEEEGVRGRQTGRKALIVIAAQEDGNGVGRIRMRCVSDASAESLMAFIEEAIEPGSVVHTDGWIGYDPLERKGYGHRVTFLKGQKESASELLPRVHLVASLLKRWLLGTHQGAVSREHLDYYLDEFTFRFNRRRSRSRGLVFYRVLELAAGHDPVRYHNIVAGKRPRKIPPTPPVTRGHPPSLERPPAERPWRAAYLDYSG
jgi:transposase-like protein